MKAIKAKPILGKRKLNLEPLFNKYGDMAIKEFKKTTETWETVNPTFEYEINGNAVLVGPADDEDGQIWVYIDEGTSVRYAIMTNPFEAKTTPGVIGSTAGVGGLAFIDMDNPQPGIEAREWSEAVGDKLEPKFVKAVQSYLKRTLRILT